MFVRTCVCMYVCSMYARNLAVMRLRGSEFFIVIVILRRRVLSIRRLLCWRLISICYVLLMNSTIRSLWCNAHVSLSAFNKKLVLFFGSLLRPTIRKCLNDASVPHLKYFCSSKISLTLSTSELPIRTKLKQQALKFIKGLPREAAVNMSQEIVHTYLPK